MSDRTIETLIAEEGFRASAYQDHLDFWTIGHGICIDARKGCGITEAESRYLLTNRVSAATTGLRIKLPWFAGLDEARQSALVQMAYQLGLGGLLGFKNMLAAIQAGDYERAAQEALNSAWAKQTPARAYRVADMIRNGAG